MKRIYSWLCSHIPPRPIQVGVTIGALLLIVAAAWGVNHYQNSPDKLLVDALGHLMSAQSATFEGSYRSTDQATPAILLTFKGEAAQNTARTQVELTTRSLQLRAELLSSSQSTFLKLENPSALAEKAVAQPLFAPFAAQLKNSAAALQGKWLKLHNDSGALDNATCAELRGIKLNATDGAKVGLLLQRYKFIKVAQVFPEEHKNGRPLTHVRLQFDPPEARPFMGGLAQIGPFAHSESCFTHLNSKASQETMAQLEKADIHLWVDSRTHTPTRLRFALMNGAAHADVELNLELDKKVEAISPPTDFVEFDNILHLIKNGALRDK